MKNEMYERMIAEDYKEVELTLKEFIEICDKLELPVFEVEVTYNPFAEPHKRVAKNMYESMSEYRKTMPSWSGRSYDYENDRISYYIPYAGIEKGDFTVRADNSATAYQWQFEVAGQCVVVHKEVSYID